MFDFLGAIICRWKGHRWSKAKEGKADAFGSLRIKHCLRCGIEREVKQRKPKVKA